MEYFEQVKAMHQLVRTFVENHEPMYKVTSIDGYATTNYMPTLGNQQEISPSRAEFVLAEIAMRFRVSARYLGSNKGLSCDVYVTSDGNLYMGDRLMSIR